MGGGDADVPARSHAAHQLVAVPPHHQRRLLLPQREPVPAPRLAAPAPWRGAAGDGAQRERRCAALPTYLRGDRSTAASASPLLPDAGQRSACSDCRRTRCAHRPSALGLGGGQWLASSLSRARARAAAEGEGRGPASGR